MPPETRYAKSGDLSIAYQVVGDGPRDLIFAPGFVSHIEVAWEEPTVVGFLERLASFSRLILFDKRGTGLSDPVPEPPTLEERIDDLRAVMDAVGSERAALLGVSEGGAMAALFAATYPARTTALVLYGAYARLTSGPGYPEGIDPDRLRAVLTTVAEHWGDGENLRHWGPTGLDDPRFLEWWGRLQRLGASPGMARSLFRSYPEMDIRGVLPTIRVPTLVLHRGADHQVPVRMGRYLAGQIPGARYVELEGQDHLFFLGDADAVLEEIEEFLTGVRRGPEPDRLLATVLFVDIVRSTELAASLGDRRWTRLLESIYDAARRQLERFRGREIKTTGDGLLATFDGPARAIRCAAAIREALRALGVEVRAGLHAGEIELLGSDVGGIAVHLGARVMAEAGVGDIVVSSTVRDLVVGSGLEFEDRGSHPLKGIPGEWRLFRVRDPASA